MWIYEIKNTITNKIYIGQTIKDNVKHRWAEHERTLNKNIHINKTLQNDWNDYGSCRFEFNAIKKCSSVDELDALEKTLIKEGKVNNNAYNISEGGQGSRIVYYKNWNGVESPDGKIYNNIENMESFAREHKLNSNKLRQVSNGKRFSYKGWKTLLRKKHNKFDYWTGKSMSSSSSEKKSIGLKRAYAEGRKVAGEKLKKLYNGIISPGGVVYVDVIGLAEFCRKHNIPSVGAMSELCSGKKTHYKGWTYNPSTTLENK